MRLTVRRVPGAQRSRYASSWPATLTSLAPGSRAPPWGKIESARATSVARRAGVQDMPCAYGVAVPAPSQLLQLLLRLWNLIFPLGPFAVFVFPYLSVLTLTS